MERYAFPFFTAPAMILSMNKKRLKKDGDPYSGLNKF
jgi:hypothetical protein